MVMIGGIFLTFRNVSREMKLARLKSDFVANVSHELRTPLALIRLYAETLELGRLNAKEKYQEYFRIIREESERLTALINNILDFSRIEAGRKEYEFKETDLPELVTSTLDSYRFQIEQHGFAFEENISRDIPAVNVDREAIARSLLNLVNNALKYSKDRKFIGVNLYRSNGCVKLEVCDHGIGIPPARAGENIREVLPLRRPAGSQHQGLRPGSFARAPHHPRTRRRRAGRERSGEGQQIHDCLAARSVIGNGSGNGMRRRTGRGRGVSGEVAGERS